MCSTSPYWGKCLKWKGEFFKFFRYRKYEVKETIIKTEALECELGIVTIWIGFEGFLWQRRKGHINWTIDEDLKDSEIAFF